jgi:hypothetical protein
MRRQPVESEFTVEVFKDTVTAYFRSTRSLYTFARFTTERDIAEFGPISPDPVIQHASRSSCTGILAVPSQRRTASEPLPLASEN